MKKVLIILLLLPVSVSAQSVESTDLLSFDTNIATEDLTDLEREILILQLRVIIIQLQDRIQEILDSRIISSTSIETSLPVLNTTISNSFTDNQSDIEFEFQLNQNTSSLFLQYLDPKEIDSSLVSQTPFVDTTRSSSVAKRISLVSTENSVSIGDTLKVNWQETGFSGFDLISLEGQSDDIRYFFGSTVPELGTYTITIPPDFKNKTSFTLYLLHNGVIKDSMIVNLN